MKKGKKARKARKYWKYEKNQDFIYLPRHSSFTIMQDFAKLGRVRHNMSGNRINTTVWTTKAHKQNRDKGKCVGRIH